MNRSPALGEADAQRRASKPALFGWLLFDFAHQPFYTLIQTFLFAPYFATAVVSDPEKGQALWGYAAAAAGLVVAIGSPILGAIADTGMRRKPWIIVFGAIFVLGLATLWIATPNLSGLSFLLVLVAYAAAFSAAEFAAVFSNAIMPTLAPKSELGRLSGLGWGLGYAGGLVALLLVAGLIVTDPASGKTLLGIAPLLKLDVAARESDRLVGPLSAAWYILFILPFFLFVPDRATGRAHVATGLGSTIGSAIDRLKATISDMVRNHRSILFLLLSRVLYSDGLAAIFVFGGIYGTAVFEWRTFDLGLFGIILSFAGAIGAIAGGWMDDRLGAKTVIMASLVILLAGVLGILSVDKTHVLFAVEIVPKAAGSAPFSSAGEKVYLAFAILIGLVAAPVQAAARSLLARLAPPDKVTQYFGLFAFSGKATAFLAPLMIAVVTQATGSMRWGVAIIAAFLVSGLVLMMPVREDGRG
ncbi:MAG: MFS transporter [Hyphomicrobiaceae bacterium]|nr:MAG: MFS transporter [Hyphomicrobiaceae bacterium]